MTQSPPETRVMKISEVRSQLNTLVNSVYRHENRVLVEKSGIPVAAIVSVEDLDRLAILDTRDRDAWEVLEAMRRPFRNVDPKEMERVTENAIAESREQYRADREQSAASTT